MSVVGKSQLVSKARVNYYVRGTRTQPLTCVGCSVHYWVSSVINKGGFFEIAARRRRLRHTLPTLSLDGQVGEGRRRLGERKKL